MPDQGNVAKAGEMPAFLRCGISRPLRCDQAYLKKHERSDPWASVAKF